MHCIFAFSQNKVKALFVVHFQTKKNPYMEEPPSKRKQIKGTRGGKIQNHSSENLKCKSVSHQTAAGQPTKNGIQFAERNHINGHLLMTFLVHF